jgi:hypothetical protein
MSRIAKRTPKMPRTRNTAAANETKDITTIIAAVNARTPAGEKIIAGFKDKFGVEITAARERNGSSRGVHYDFEVEVDQVWKKVEHKGGQAFRLPRADDVPWKAGVQFHNGGCEKYTIAKKYAITWYETYISSNSLREEFDIVSPTPSFDEWFAKDCRTQADPKTAFGKELKKAVRAKRGNRASLLDKRVAVLESLEINDSDMATLIDEVLPIANHALEQKDYWLSIHGNLDGDFHACWYPKFTIGTINSAVAKKNLDLEIKFHCDNDFNFNGILRWGKGAGFSCLRVDLK